MKRKIALSIVLSMTLASTPMLIADPPAAPPATATAPAKPKRPAPPIVGTLDVTNALPDAFDKNMVQGDFVYQGNELLSGNSDIRPPYEGRIDQKVKVDKLVQPPGTALLRAEFDTQKTRDLLGSKASANAAQQAISLVDSNGKVYLPIGYFWQKAGRAAQVRIDRNELIKTGHDIPFREVGAAKERIYLYWQVQKGVKITALNVGLSARFDVEVQTK